MKSHYGTGGAYRLVLGTQGAKRRQLPNGNGLKVPLCEPNFFNHGLIVQQILRFRNTLGYIVDLALRKINPIGIPYRNHSGSAEQRYNPKSVQ